MIRFMSPTITLKVIHDFISQASGQVSSRDIGRYLKSISVGDGDTNILTQLKNTYAGGLKSFLRQYGRDIFDITEKDSFGRDKRDMSFWYVYNIFLQSVFYFKKHFFLFITVSCYII